MPDRPLAPGLHLHTSNRLETLAAALATVTHTPLSSPFRPETIVVQSQGMARWLKQQLADRHGICAQVRFPFPNEMASELFLATFPELPVRPPFDREVMLWLVMKHLPALLDAPGFEEVRHYLEDRADLRKRHQLARKVSHLFDQYFIFRPDLVRSWDHGDDEGWQAQLWRRIRPEIPHRHPAELQALFAQWMHQAGAVEASEGGAGFETPAKALPLPSRPVLPNPPMNLAGQNRSQFVRSEEEELSANLRARAVRLPERLCVFGISALPPFHLELFTALGVHLPVHLFVVQPSRFYWGDITSNREKERMLKRHQLAPSAAAGLHLETGNRLLASLGPLGRDFLKLIYESGDWQEFDDFTEPEGDTLLARIQSDILNLRDRGRDTLPIPEEPALPPAPVNVGNGHGSAHAPAPVRRRNKRSDTDQMFLPFLAEAPAVQVSKPALVTPPPPTRTLMAPGDDSVQVHSCHSPLRELEVLHDHLLEWFSRDPDLAPRDIVVMMPDIETYAPFVEAVFGSPEEEARRIPFRIADRGARQASQLLQTFLALLRLPQTRLGAATVLALLENRAVRERFGLSEPDLELVRHWVEETRIRWGADPAHRARLELPALPDNTWRDGLDRLLLGYAMNGRNQGVFAGLAPYEDLEGHSATVLGRLAEFIEQLFGTTTDLGRARSLEEWATRLQRLLEDFFQPDEENEPDLQIVRSLLHGLRQQHAQSGFSDAVDLAVVLEQLAPELEQDRHGTGFLSGGVTFCALKPMRSIPFKVICLVGMNDAVFPRPNVHLSFDLMARLPRLGDRSTRNDDRYLFLETILSARDRLYLSYVGQSIRDNSPIPPSVVVSELLDYVEQGFTLAPETGPGQAGNKPGTLPVEPKLRDRLVTWHRLQAFHEAYFQPESRLFSYSVENCRASQATRRAGPRYTPLLNMPLGNPEPEFRQVSIEDLASFLCNPAGYLLQHRLSIRLRQTEGALEEREAFALDARDGYSLKQQLLDERLAGNAAGQTLAQIAASGVLPLGQVGEASRHTLTADLDAFWQRLRPFHPDQASTGADIDLALGGFRLSGRLKLRPAGGILSFRVAAIKAVDILRLWIRHLASCAAGHGGESILVGTDNIYRYRSIAKATDVLHDLLQIYWAGLHQPLKFFPRSALAFVRSADKHAGKPDAVLKARVEALKQWEGNSFSHVSPERSELSFDLCFGDEAPLDEEFERLAQRVFTPVLDHEEEEK